MSRNQIVGVGMDYSPMSKLAVRWAVENFVNIGDRFVVIHVSSKFDHPQKNLWENSGSRITTSIHYLFIYFNDFVLRY